MCNYIFASLLCVVAGISAFFVLPIAAASASITPSSTALVDTLGPPFGQSETIASISCPSSTLCVGVDQLGAIVTSTAPTGDASSDWTRTVIDGSQRLNAVACPSTTLCLAVDDNGDVYTSTDPTGGAGDWTGVQIDINVGSAYGNPLDAVACASTTSCVVGDANGNILDATDPTGSASAWTTTVASNGGGGISGLSCPTTTFCAATTSDASNNSEVLTTAAPTAGSPVWVATEIDATNALSAISCASSTSCVAVDADGNVVTAADPLGNTAGDWTTTNLGGTAIMGSVDCPTTSLCLVGGDAQVFVATNPLGSDPADWTGLSSVPSSNVTCSPDVALCVAFDGQGDAYTATSAYSTAASWSSPVPADAVNSYSAISCPSATACVAADDDGNLSVSTDPTGGIDNWTTFDADSTNAITALSCPSTTECIAFDTNGGELTSTNPTSGNVSDWTVTPSVADSEVLALSCPSTTECIAITELGTVETSTDPLDPSQWATTTGVVTSSPESMSISCASIGECIAVDSGGNVYASTDPLGNTTGSWTSVLVASAASLDSISCPSTTLCIAGGSDSNIYWSTDPTSGNAADWTAVAVGNTNLGASACPSTTECFVASAGSVYSTTTPTGDSSTWALTNLVPDDTDTVQVLSCPTTALCVGGDGQGDVFSLAVTAPSAQTVSFTTTAPSNAPANDSDAYDPTVTETGGSGYPIVLTIDSSATSVCSLAEPFGYEEVSTLGAGTCVIDANQAGGVGYAAANQVQQSFVVAGTAQTVSFTSTAPTGLVYGTSTTYTATADASSGLTPAITVDSSSTSVCSINGSNVVSFQHAGTCTLDANQAGGSGGYEAAPQVQQSITIAKAAQTASFTSTAPTHAVVGVANYTPTATASSGLTPTISVDASTTNSACSISTGTVSFNNAGTCVLDANQTGNADHNAAAEVQQSFAVSPEGSQAVTFASSAPLDATVGGTSYTPTASGTASGNTVSITVDASSSAVCSISSGSVTFAGTGSCELDANQAGGNGYTAAPQVQQSFTVHAAGTQMITFTSTAPSSAPYGATYAVTASGGGSTSPVVISVDSSSTAECSINGSNVVSFTGLGICTVDANQAAQGGYSAASQVQQTITVVKAAQTVSFTSSAPSNATYGGATYTVTATGGGSGSPAVITVDSTGSAYCSISGSTVSFIRAGGCVLDANQTGSTDYSAAAQSQQSFTVEQAAEALTFTSAAPASAIVGGSSYDPIALSIGGTGGAVSISVDSSAATVCSMSNGAVSFGGSGTCVLDANQSASTNYLASAQIQQSFRVAAAANGNAAPPAGVAAADFGTPQSRTVVANVATLVNESYGGAVAQVSVPAGALPTGTTVSTYPVTNPSAVSGSIPSGQAYVLSFGVSWTTPSGTSPAATQPITMMVTDPSIVAGDVIYQVTSTGLRAVGAATVNGVVTITFTSDPTFVVAAVPHLALSVKHGAVGAKGITMKFSCSAALSCAGRANLTVARVAKHGKHSVVTQLVVARANLSIGKGRSGSVLFKVTPSGAGVLARSGSGNNFRLGLVVLVTGATRSVGVVKV